MAIQWSGWESLGQPIETDIGRPIVQRNQDGRLEVFGIGLGDIFNIFQVAPNGGWHDSWVGKGRPSLHIGVKMHAVLRNADGRQEIFALGEDNAIWQKWQVAPNNGWSDWKSLGTPAQEISFNGQFTVGINQDGRQEIFAVGNDGNIWQAWQTAPNNGWSKWGKLGQPTAGIRSFDRITVGKNLDGRQELFLVGGDDALWHIWQVAPNAGWTGWESLGKPKDSKFSEPQPRDLSEPFVQENPDGHLEVFALGNGAFCNRWQEAPNSPVWRHQGWNAKPPPNPEVEIVWMETTLDLRRQRVEAFAIGTDGGLWHSWQIFVPPFWSPWQSLERPPAKLRESDRLAIGINQDDRIEVFVVGQDGAVWHIWQTH